MDVADYAALSPHNARNLTTPDVYGDMGTWGRGGRSHDDAFRGRNIRGDGAFSAVRIGAGPT